MLAATWKKIQSDSGDITCPPNYVLVPALATYTTRDFCVMKYEAKNDGYGTAVSNAAGAPWVNINRATSRSNCQALGLGYDMISNDQWQTIVRNIAGVASNWSNGTVTSGELNRGHTDNAPGSALAAVTDDNDPCNGTGQGCSASIWNGQRRTHTLSNGNVIWDLSGNVWEWVTNDNTVSNGADGYTSTMSGGDIRQTRYGAAAFCATPGVSPYCGMGYAGVSTSAGAVRRSGGWTDGVYGGVFVVDLNAGPAAANTLMGFRCVFVP